MCGGHVRGELRLVGLCGVFSGVLLGLGERRMHFMRRRNHAGKQRERRLHELCGGPVRGIVGLDDVHELFAR